MDPIPVSPPLPPSPAIVPPGGTKEGPVPRPSKRLWLLAGLGILVAGILVGFLGSNVLNLSTNQSAITPTSIPTPTPTLATGADIFADWKSYTNTAFRYSIKYPNDWKASSFGPGVGTVPLDTIQRGLLLTPSLLPPAEGMGIPLEDISIHLEVDSAQTSGMMYDAWVNDVKKNVASTTISISETTLSSTKTIVIQKEFSAVYLLPSPDKSLFYSIEVRSPTPDYRDTLDQILSTFRFLD